MANQRRANSTTAWISCMSRDRIAGWVPVLSTALGKPVYTQDIIDAAITIAYNHEKELVATLKG